MTSVPPAPTSPVEFGVISTALETDYEVMEELGRGGMAVVYRAREKALDREVAIKVLPGILAFDISFVERFEREARTAAQLEHPNIVPIYRVGKSGQVTFFVMKLMRGMNLSAIMRERPKLPASDVRRMLLDCAAALGYAAKRGVVHRDIKPDNIMIDEGRCVVADFGIAKTQSGPITAAGTSMGTPRYMSPEHAQGLPLDGRSDMYSLGVVAYQALTGTIPFDGDDPFSVLYKHINSPVPKPNLTGEDEVALFAIIEKMLAKKPDDRFQNADHLIAALGGEVTSTSQTLVGGISPLRLPAVEPTEIIDTGARTLLRNVRKHWLAWVAGVAIVAVGTGGYMAFAESRGATSGRRGGASGSLSSVTKSPLPPVRLTPGAATPPAATRTAPAPEPYSKCPRPSRSFALLVDNVPPRAAGSPLKFSYDVCGLAPNAPYTGDIVVRPMNVNAFRRLMGGAPQEVKAAILENAINTRSRRTKTVDVSALPPGDYSLTVAIRDAKNRYKETRREFRIQEKKQ